MIQEELHNKEALHQDTRTRNKEAHIRTKEVHHKDHHQVILKEAHLARLETYLARNDWSCTL